MEKFFLEIPNFIPDDVCTSIIRRFETDERKNEGAYTWHPSTEIIRQKENMEICINSLSDWDDISKLFSNYTCTAFQLYMKHLKNTFNEYGDPRYPVYSREDRCRSIIHSGFALQRIEKGNKYSWHHDWPYSYEHTHFIQLIFYLNTLEESQGGYTEFVDGTKVRPEMGKLLIFPCSWNFPHEGCTVKDGYKYIMSTTVSLISKRDDIR